MKKKILMIGNTDGLPGVPVDLDAYYSFFTSPVGGNWHHEEIEILRNPTMPCLCKRIDAIERACYDYVVTIFTGHGSEGRRGVTLDINERSEKVEMRYLANLSPKQLIILDCCRVFETMLFGMAFMTPEATMLSMFHDPIRQAYEYQIQDSCPQKIVLFACDQGEESMDSYCGGKYSLYLLSATKMAIASGCSPFVSVSQAHHKAVSLMRRENPPIRQRPQILQSHSPLEQCLPLAINPYYWS